MQAVLGESSANLFEASADTPDPAAPPDTPPPAVTHDDFTSPGEPPVETPEPETPPEDETPPADTERERNPDGTFKAKAGTPEGKPETKPEAAKPRDDPHARVKQATAKEATAKRERDEARAEAARLRAELDAVRAPRQEPPRQPAARVPAEDLEPNPEDATKYPEGQFDRQFLKDQARWEAKQEIAQREAAYREREIHERKAQRVQEAETKFRERIAAAPNLPERLSPQMHAFLGAAIPASALPPSQPIAFVNVMGEAFLHAEHPDRLIQHFSDHPDDLQRFSTLHPADFYRSLGILEAHLDAAAPSGPAPRATPISQAKPLIQPVSSGPSASEEDPNALDDLTAFVRENNKRDPRFRRRA